MGLTQRWFDKRLGLALAETSTGLAGGVAGFSYLVATCIAAHGWRPALVIARFTAMTIGVTNLALLVRDSPGSIPETERRQDIARDEIGGVTLGAALQTRDFWLFAISFLLVIFAVVGCNFHLPALLSDRGASPAMIASIVAIGSAGSLFGRLFTGIMLDRFSARSVSAVFFLGQAVGFLLLLDGLHWVLPAGFLARRHRASTGLRV